MKGARVVSILMGLILTAKLGRIDFNGHPETFYNLKMDRIVERATENGIIAEYWERDDGCKMYGDFIIVATDWNKYPYGSFVETSLGIGIVLDTGTFKDRETVDIATTW